jgi:flagellar motor protein MotB
MYVVVMAVTSKTAPEVDVQLRQAQEQLEERLSQQKTDGDILDYCAGPARVRIIYPESFLSFQECRWGLSREAAEKVQSHLREPLFQELAQRGQITGLRIEGHADSRRAQGCKNLAPFRDNLQLSQNRARALFDAVLSAEGADAGAQLEDIQNGYGPPAPEGLAYVQELTRKGRISVAGFGAMRPYQALNPDCSPADASSSIPPDSPKNRRVEVTVDLGSPRTSPLAGEVDPAGGREARFDGRTGAP